MVKQIYIHINILGSEYGSPAYRRPRADVVARLPGSGETVLKKVRHASEVRSLAASGPVPSVTQVMNETHDHYVCDRNAGRRHNAAKAGSRVISVNSALSSGIFTRTEALHIEWRSSASACKKLPTYRNNKNGRGRGRRSWTIQ